MFNTDWMDSLLSFDFIPEKKKNKCKNCTSQ